MVSTVLFDYKKMRIRLFRLLNERVNKLSQYQENLTSYGTLIGNKGISFAKLECPGINDMKWYSNIRTEYQNEFTTHLLNYLKEEINVYYTSII